jgi:nitroreductase
MGKLHEIGRKWRLNPLQISEDILYRWSPRKMNGEAVSEAELLPLLEAARWAPSSRNSQEWRFFYALGGDRHFDTLMSFLSEGNQSWCSDAGALLILVSKKTTHDNHTIRSHSLDTGMAYQNFHIEGTRRDLVVHPMGAFDRQKVDQFLKLGEDYHIEIMISVGKPEAPEVVESDRKPTERVGVETFSFRLTD